MRHPILTIYNCPQLYFDDDIEKFLERYLQRYRSQLIYTVSKTIYIMTIIVPYLK